MENEDQPKLRVFAYSPSDDRLFVYNHTEEEIQEDARIFHQEIWFYLSAAEIAEFLTGDAAPQNNLKYDYIYFNPKINGMAQMVCTCKKFDEWSNNHDKLAKLAVKHARRTGHTLNPRGN